MPKIKVDWEKLDGMSKRTLENRDTFETSRARLQELVDELMNYWKGQDAENYHERATAFLDYLKGETDHMDRWGKFFGRASGNYKSGVEEGLKSVKKATSVIEEAIVNPKALLIEDNMIGTEYNETFTMAPDDQSANVVDGRHISELKTEVSNQSGHLDGRTVPGPIDQIPENNGPKQGPISQIPENNGPKQGPIAQIPENNGPKQGPISQIPENNGPLVSDRLRSSQGFGGTVRRAVGSGTIGYGSETSGPSLGSGKGSGGSALNEAPMYREQPNGQRIGSTEREVSVGEVRYPDGYAHISGLSSLIDNGGNN